LEPTQTGILGSNVVVNEDQDRTRLGNSPRNPAVLKHMACIAMQKK
jgi:hypothetical protein